MCVVAAIAIGTVVSAGVDLYEGSQQQKIANTELGMAQTTQGEQQYYNSMLQQLIANPSSVSSLPGYQFQLSQGSAAVADQMAASGFAGSGNEAAALTSFGQGLASSFYGQQANLLASLSGVTAASSPAQSANVATGASATSTATLNNMLAQLGASYGLYSSMANPNTTATAGTPAEDALVQQATNNYMTSQGFVAGGS